MQKTARKNTKYSRNEKILKVGHLAKAIAHAKSMAFAKWSVWVKNDKCQKHAKNRSKRTLELFCAKNRLKKTLNISRNGTILKIGDLAKAIAHAKAIAFAKWSVWVKNYKCQKHAKHRSNRTLELFCANNRSKKTANIREMIGFQNRLSCKGYRLCKMVSLGQKIKMPKTCEKPF